MRKRSVLVCFWGIMLMLFSFCSCDRPSDREREETMPLSGRNLLSSEKVKSYDRITEAVSELKSQVPLQNLTSEDFKQIMEYYRADHPEVFWLYDDYSYELSSLGKKVTSAQFTYGYQEQSSDEFFPLSRKTITQMAQEQKEVGEKILSEIAAEKSDYEKIKYLHDYLAMHVSYDRNGDFQHHAYGALVEKKAVCDGIAKAFQLLAGKLGIESRVVYGCSADGVYHAWNVVQLDGNYYHLDITWDMPSGQEKSPTYLYFCLDDEQICKNRILFSPREGKAGNLFSSYLPIPDCVKLDYFYYFYEDLQIKDYLKEGLSKICHNINRAMQDGQEEIQLLFYQKRDYLCFVNDISGQGSGTSQWNAFLQESEISSYQIIEREDDLLVILQWQNTVTHRTIS